MTNTTTHIAIDRFRGPLDLVRMRAGEGKELVYCSLTGAMKVLPVSAVHLLQSCRTFATLDEHARRLCPGNGKVPDLQSISQQLCELAENGLLLSYNELIRKLLAEPIEEAPPAISAVTIPTRNRAESLERTIDSYAQYSLEHGREIQFFIADQSDLADTCQANLDVLARAKKKFGGQFFYAGAAEKEDLARTLAKHTGHQFDLINFAVSNDEHCPKAYGANRNALLLSTTGRLIIQTDDDNECPIAPCPETKDYLTLTSQYSPLQMRFLSQAEVEHMKADFVPGDVMAKHEQLLGKSIAHCLQEYSSVKLDDTNGSFFTRSQPRRVAVTALGIAGESGIGTSFYFLNDDELRRASLLRSKEDYQYAMANHDLLRFVVNPTISDGTVCGGMHLGLDNRFLLPPFTPVQRNEDGVFGELVKLGSSGYFGFLPWLILRHGQSRNYTSEDLCSFVSSVQTGQIIATLVTGLNPRPTSLEPGKNMVALGRLFAEWGAAPIADFEEMLRLMLMQRASRQIAKLDYLMTKYAKEPSFWANDVDMCMSAMTRAITEKRYIIPSDLSESFGEEEARVLIQRLVRRFGQLLQVWPDLIEAANQLRISGWQPFRQI